MSPSTYFHVYILMLFSDLARSNSTQPQSSLVSAPVRRSKSDQKRPAKPLSNCLIPTKSLHASPSTFQGYSGFNTQDTPSKPSKSLPRVTVESPSTSSASSTSAPPTPQQAEAARSYQCELCDYIPTGDEKWKPSNLRRHKRTQHASADKKGAWVCRWEGCTKSFTRSDNLRSHMRDKGHDLVERSNPHVLQEEPEDNGQNDEDHDSEEVQCAEDSMTTSKTVQDSDGRDSKRRKLAVN
jgi:hypothetical protein